MKKILISIVIIIILIAGFFVFNSYIYNEKQADVTSEEVLEGHLVMGHEARVFTPCNDTEELWVLGDSPAYSEMLSEYQSWVSEQDDPYSPLFATLSGIITDAPTDGFGADYNLGLRATKLIKIDPSGVCN